MKNEIRAVDLFAGGGGESTGLVQAIKQVIVTEQRAGRFPVEDQGRVSKNET